MPFSKEILNVDNLDLLTAQEKKFNDVYVKKLLDYASDNGKVTGVEMKNLTAGAAVIAKRQQSRSATALLKYNIESKNRLISGGCSDE